MSRLVGGIEAVLIASIILQAALYGRAQGWFADTAARIEHPNK
jgi:hypothetical protein